jgi:hypothetical protein
LQSFARWVTIRSAGVQAMVFSAQQKDEIKKNVMSAFEEALDRIDSYARRPSRWEEDGLVRALVSMTCGNFIDAAFELRDLLEGSSAKVNAGREMSRPPRRFPLTTHKLREGLANLRALD